jgi:hypothetical protein
VTKAKPVPEGLIERFGLGGATARPLGAGLINQTWSLTAPDGARFVLQRLNPIFAAEVNEDIDVSEITDIKLYVFYTDFTAY